MTYLLDVNLLIALCDPDHVHHELAHQWFSVPATPSWATCALTENAFIRITGKTTYLNWKRTPKEQIDMLCKFCSLPSHEFWTEDVSLLDAHIWIENEHVRANDLTDLYLLALAVKHGGRLASFDRRIPAHLIRGGREALHILPA